MSEISTNYLKHAFTHLGLTDEHALIYLSNLQLGETTASKIAKNAQIPRTSTYDLLDDLEEWSFVRKVLKKRKSYFIPENPIRIQEQLEYKRNRVNDITYSLERNLHELETLYSKNEQKTSNIKIFQGKKDLKTVLFSSLLSSRLKMVTTLSTENHAGIDLISEFFDEADITNLEIEQIITDNENAQDHIDEYKHNPNFDIILLPENEMDSSQSTDKVLFDGHIMHINYEKESAVLINDKSQFNIEKKVFENVWRIYKEKFGIV